MTEKDDWLAAQGTVTDYFMIELMNEETQQYQPNYKDSVKFTTEYGEERPYSFWQKGAEPYEGQVVDLIYDPNSDDHAKGPLPEKKDFSKIYVARYVSIGYAGIVAAVYVAWLLSLKKKRQSAPNSRNIKSRRLLSSRFACRLPPGGRPIKCPCTRALTHHPR